MSKSTFALELDISLPVMTHISTGRNKPGIDLIQKLLSRFEEISPDWLLLGKGTMLREKERNVDLSPEIQRIKSIGEAIPNISRNTQQVQEYHKLLLKEISYLNDLQPYLAKIGSDSLRMSAELKEIRESILVKLSH